MEAEKLKVIAEGMEYIILGDSSLYPTVKKDKHSKVLAYNPLTNNDQMVEIMERLLDKSNYSIHAGFDGAFRVMQGNKIKATGKTINKAVCNAAYEYYKDGE